MGSLLLFLQDLQVRREREQARHVPLADVINASVHDALAFALKYKLPCWGIFTYSALDDAYVVPGPYAEL